jgi:hypothetical protein
MGSPGACRLPFCTILRPYPGVARDGAHEQEVVRSPAYIYFHSYALKRHRLLVLQQPVGDGEERARDSGGGNVEAQQRQQFDW